MIGAEDESRSINQVKMMPFAKTHDFPFAVCEILMGEGYRSHLFLAIPFLHRTLFTPYFARQHAVAAGCAGPRF
jgi:hypothetical protein